MSTTKNEDQQNPTSQRDSRANAIRIAVWFACIGGLAIPLVLWATMSSSMLILGPDVGLKVRIVAENFLTMAWPTVIVLIAPGLGVGVIAALLVANMILWGAVGFVSEKVISHQAIYYGVLVVVVLGLFISNGSFIWMAFEKPPLPFNLIDIPSFIVAAVIATAIFIIRRRVSGSI